jgi:hypothetical protein
MERFFTLVQGCLLSATAAISLALGGCVTPDVDYSSTRAGWQGAPYDTVVAQWGQPVRYTVRPDGIYVYTWLSEAAAAGSSSAVYPSIGVFGGSRGVGVGVGTGIAVGGGGGELVRCERTFAFDKAVVVEQTWVGSSRFCSTFVRR